MNEINYKRTTIRLCGFLFVDLGFDFDIIKDIPVAGPFLSFRHSIPSVIHLYLCFLGK